MDRTGARYLARCDGEELGVADRQIRARELAAVIAAHYGVELPEIHCGYVRRAGAVANYRPAQPGVNALISLVTDSRIHTGNIARVTAHEMTHHLDYVLHGKTGMNAIEAHGPEFAASMAEVLRVICPEAPEIPELGREAGQES